MSNVWLKCDQCNKDLHAEAAVEMQLAVRFKPTLFPQSLERIHPQECRRRCRSCGWVNVFVPSASVTADRHTAPLTPRWRTVTLKSS